MMGLLVTFADAATAGAKPDPSLALMGYVVSNQPAAVTPAQLAAEVQGDPATGSKATGAPVLH